MNCPTDQSAPSIQSCICTYVQYKYNTGTHIFFRTFFFDEQLSLMPYLPSECMSICMSMKQGGAGESRGTLRYTNPYSWDLIEPLVLAVHSRWLDEALTAAESI